MATELTFEVAKGLATSLSTIKGFPRHDAAITAVALDLIDWCKGKLVGKKTYSPEQQAQIIVQEARLNWLEWTSMADLRAVFRAKFEAEAEYSLQRQFGKKPVPDCLHCNDTGVRRLKGGKDVWCDCEMGLFNQRECPGLIRLHNAHRMPRPQSPIASRASEPEVLQSMIELNEATVKDPHASKRDKQLARQMLSRFKPAEQEAS